MENSQSLGTVHTHTHTHTYNLQKKKGGSLFNFFLLFRSKGGSREQLEVSRLPRDLIG